MSLAHGLPFSLPTSIPYGLAGSAGGLPQKNYLLQEDSFKFILENGSGFILLEA